MKAIEFKQPSKLEEGDVFGMFELNMPQPSSRELLAKIQSISVSPVDTKQRLTGVKSSPRILGLDAVGMVQKTGTEVTMFKEGDIIFYSGASNQHGSNQEYQLIDERLVAKAPRSLSTEQTVSLPLTGITASETLFDVFKISEDPSQSKGKSLPIINGAGGVGSITAQTAKAYGLKVITTVSHQETIDWSKKMGTDIILNYKEDLKSQLEQQHIEVVDFVFCTSDTDMHYETTIDIVEPRGHVATIVVFRGSQDLNLLETKSVSFTHEFMLTRSIFQAEDMIKHRYYLEDIAKKIENGAYQNTTIRVINGLTAERLYEAHQVLEFNSTIGKLVINAEE